MQLREATSADTTRLRELAKSTMTSTYALSPQQLDAIVEEHFGEDHLLEVIDDGTRTLLVKESSVGKTDGDDEAETETTIAGLVEGSLEENNGAIHWLFVDPEHRGKGIGTELFESMIERLRNQDAEHVTASTLEANMEGHQFFEELGFERAGDRTIEVGGESLTEYEYAESAPNSPSEPISGQDMEPDTELPEAETSNGITTATTDDGQQAYINRDEMNTGTEGPFFVVYTDEEYTEQFGYYCANCGSLDTVMDNMERIECSGCGNAHAERSGDAYDDSYL
ncbi:GNAT family N-acetyltransferase [Halococcus sediminicola]|uniref:GNAT family N-acetyltransferase n=1 Tax=Halococcus sediminicola TaxID=1264579 RepID=UPI00067897B5|nr:GNAT family N-acetyltransferase [Halococcus sediminicola]